MIISNVSSGPKAAYSLDGTKLTVGEIEIDLQNKQKSVQRVIDICLDNQLETMREGLGAWYVANIVIPSRQYELRPNKNKKDDDEEDDGMEEVELPVDTSKVELRLWGLPPAYFEDNDEYVDGEDENEDEGEDE